MGMTISWNEKRVIREVLSEKDTERRNVGLADTPGGSLLDSSLIIKYNDWYFPKDIKEKYNTKIIKCGDYVQVYFFKNYSWRKKSNLEKLDDEDDLVKKSNINRLGEKNYVEFRNVQRAKFKLQRLVKANEEVFKTFITLTFEENEKDIKKANKKFNYWVSNIRKLKKDFKYVCVPEYQKRGAVHYHLMTNIEITDNKIILSQEKRVKKTKKLKRLYDVRYWNQGYSSVFDLKDIDNTTAYITKYMTKDVDNRLFGSRKYHFSRNLIQPKEYYIDLGEIKQFEYLKNLTTNCEVKFNNIYKNKYNFEDVIFFEYKNLCTSLHNNYYMKLLIISF